MSHRLYAFVFTVIMIFSVAKANAQTPLEFNDNLVAITDSLYKKGQDWGEKFTAVRDSKEFYKLAPQRKALEKFIDTKIAEISVMKDISGSENLRKAMVKFLLFEKDMIQRGFMPIEKLNSSSTQEQIDAALEKLTSLTEEENEALGNVNREQEAYAKKNGFTIESVDE